MKTTQSIRRGFIKALAASPVLALAGWPASGIAADAALQARKITDNLTLISGAGGNVVLFKGSDGLTLVDSGMQTSSAELLALIDELSNKSSISRVFNTHWHEDHTGGNEALHARGARILAHENTRLWLGAEFDVYWRNQSHQPRPREAMPELTWYTSGSLDAGGELLQYSHYPQAHTDGDLTVFFPNDNVLVAGGLLANKRYPVCDIATGGWIGGLLKANEAMLAQINDSTVLIPDSGAPQTKADLQAQYDMLNDLYTQMKALAQQGFNGKDMLNDRLTAKYDAVFGDPEEFVLETYRGMWAHTYDMGGFI